MNPHEEAAIRSFLLPHRRTRWLESLASETRRRLFLDKLNHCRDLDERFCTPLPPGEDTLARLRARGAGRNCHVVSMMERLDGRDMPLAEALDQTEAGGWGTLICCVPGRLAYYHDEMGLRRRLLERPDF